jgi:hypothetical protein
LKFDANTTESVKNVAPVENAKQREKLSRLRDWHFGFPREIKHVPLKG